MGNRCKICKCVLKSSRAKTCSSNKCKSKWKIERNKNLSPISKRCRNCTELFQTVDRRNNFCSSSCKSKYSNQTKIEKYGTLSLESKNSIKQRSKNLIKPKIPCSIDNCTDNARTKGFCSNHYIKYDYLQTEHGKNVYRLGKQRRRDLESSKIMSKAELIFLKDVQGYCMKCKTTEDLSMDHHVPLSKGGSLELTNTIILCRRCNSAKNNKSPEEFYTEKELLEIENHFNFIKKTKEGLKTVYFLFGCFGSGKTWVANQLIDTFNVIEYDKHKKQSIKVIDDSESDKPILYVSPVMITPFINKYSMKYNIHAIALVEDLETIKERILKRGGTVTPNITKRQKRIVTISNKYADFSGNSVEVLNYLKSI